MTETSDGLHVRRPVPSDHQRALAVLDDWWSGSQGAAGSHQRAHLLPRLFFEHFTDTSYLVEGPDGEVLGFLIGFLSPAHPRLGYIHFVGVSPAARRRGIAAHLYRLFTEHAVRRGVRELRCITSPGNALSVAFHTGLGFEVDPGDRLVDDVAVQGDYDGPGVDRITFTHRLVTPLAPSATGETDLRTLLRSLSPLLHPGRYVYTVVHGAMPAGVKPVVLVREAEGLTLVVPREQADALGLTYTYVAAWITLGVHSALEAVGVTAAVSGALAAAGISANVVAGFAHDHVFVPYERAADAMRTLSAVAAGPCA